MQACGLRLCAGPWASLVGVIILQGRVCGLVSGFWFMQSHTKKHLGSWVLLGVRFERCVSAARSQPSHTMTHKTTTKVKALSAAYCWSAHSQMSKDKAAAAGRDSVSPCRLLLVSSLTERCTSPVPACVVSRDKRRARRTRIRARRVSGAASALTISTSAP